MNYPVDLHRCTDEDFAKFWPASDIYADTVTTYSHTFLCFDPEQLPEDKRTTYGNWESDTARVLKVDLTVNPIACEGYPEWGPADGSGVTADDFPDQPYCKFRKDVQALAVAGYVATLTNNQRFS